METETKFRPVETIALVDYLGTAEVFRIEDHDEDTWLTLAKDELQTVVQLAYDRFGILAAPSYDVEAERAPELDPLQMIHDHVNKAHARQAENRSGVQALGFASVHGVGL